MLDEVQLVGAFGASCPALVLEDLGVIGECGMGNSHTLNTLVTTDRGEEQLLEGSIP